MADSASPADDLNSLLQALSDGEEGAADALYTRIYSELHGLARGLMRHERQGHTLQATALVNEAFLRLTGGRPVDYDGRPHFMGVAARAMRAVLVDHARRRGAAKRGGGAERVALDELVTLYEAPDVDLLTIDEALGRLEAEDAQLARLVELRYFGGLTIAETATAMGISTATVDRGWRSARAYLLVALGL